MVKDFKHLHDNDGKHPWRSDEGKMKDKRIAELEAALKAAFTAMSVASCINAVRAEYDFEPVIHQAHKALLPDNRN